MSWLVLHLNGKGWFNRLTIIPQQKQTKTKTKKVRRVVTNQYSLLDIPNHAAGVEDGDWDVFFILRIIKCQLILILTIYFSLILISPYCCFAGACIQTKHLRTGSSASLHQFESSMCVGHVKRGDSYLKIDTKLFYSLKYFCPDIYLLLNPAVNAPLFKESLISRLMSWKPWIRGFRNCSFFLRECREIGLRNRWSSVRPIAGQILG